MDLAPILLLQHQHLAAVQVRQSAHAGMRQLLPRHADCGRPWSVSPLVQRPVWDCEGTLAINVLAGDLRQWVVGVGDEQLLLAVLEIGQYVQGSVVRAELGNRPALELSP